MRANLFFGEPPEAAAEMARAVYAAASLQRGDFVSRISGTPRRVTAYVWPWSMRPQSASLCWPARVMVA
jgi:hypothetical protein